MAKQGVFLELKGIDKVLKKYGRIPKQIEAEADAEFAAAANTMANRAISDAPTDQGALKNQISSVRHGMMNHETVSAAPHSAYIEWGTRTRVQVPPELQKVAAQYKGASSGKNAQEMIYEWCRRNGIERGLWWPIFISIMTKGIHPHPFFFKNFYAIVPDAQKKIAAALKRALND